MSVDLRCGDSFDLLDTLADNSVDTVILDPPAGISFMGKDWDSDRGGRDAWIAWLSAILAKCLRVAKPGSMMLCWALPRTSHWTGMAIENAGWEVRDVISHLFGSGFPKSLDISKALDKAVGAEREVMGGHPYANRGTAQSKQAVNLSGSPIREAFITAPATPAAREWDGYGTALKPACEFWWLAMKPVEKNFATNALKWGVAGLNVDAGRIAGNVPSVPQPKFNSPTGRVYGFQTGEGRNGEMSHAQGRFPSHVVLSHSPNCNGSCADDCPVRLLDEQSGITRSVGGHGEASKKWRGDGSTVGASFGQGTGGFGDTGGASRFFRIVSPEMYCVLCNLPIDTRHGITNETQSEVIPCETVNGATRNLRRNGKSNDSVLTLARHNGQPKSADKSESLNTPANNVGANGKAMQATNGYFVPSDARLTAIAKNVQSAKSAENLCDSCVTAIAQSIVAMQHGKSPESIPFLDSMPDYKKHILIQNLAPFVEMLASTDTIPTIPSLKLLFGSVFHAIANYTKPESDAARENTSNVPTRFRYQSKASRRERDAGLEGMPEHIAGSMEANVGEVMQLGAASLKGEHKQIQPRRNTHPTVKPVTLLEYLCNLTRTPTGGVVLDPFMGSGSTIVAAIRTGRSAIGFEAKPEYYEIALARARHAQQGQPTLL